MHDQPEEGLAKAVATVLSRYLRQNAVTGVETEAIACVAERFERIAARRASGMAGGEGVGEPPEMSGEEVAAIVTEVLAGIGAREVLTTPVKQLVKGCFQATRRTCRGSYREVDGTGVCRRQMLAKARERVSGTHCVDCPYWMQLTAQEHERLLANAWVSPGGAAELAAQRGIFLPEDFRALRRWVRV